MREDSLVKRRAQIVQQIWEAYEASNFAEMHRLRIAYNMNGRGPKKRFYYSPKTHWTAEQWLHELGKHPHEGGLGGTQMD
eukprot:9466133-Pyramimonas_sp.AAC.1